MQTLLAYSRSIDIDWLYEGRVVRYPHNAATGELGLVPPRSMCRQKHAADGSSITCNVGEVPVTSGKVIFMKISEPRSAAEASGVQLDETFPLHLYNGTEGGDDNDGEHAEQI